MSPRRFASALALGLCPACFNPSGNGELSTESTALTEPPGATDDPSGGPTSEAPTTAEAPTTTTTETGPDGLDPCKDGQMGGDETDLDCGGSCPPCAEGLVCVGDEDCATGMCVREVCVSASCEAASDCPLAECQVNACEDGVCVSSPRSGGACDDGLVCTVDEGCAAGTCTASSPEPIALTDLGGEEPIGTRYDGAAPAQLAGESVGPAGDFDGDGIADLMVVTRAVGVAPPRVYVLHGGPGLANATLAGVAMGQGGFMIEADVGDPSVVATTIGDHDGDGRDDVVIGAATDANKGGRGGVYVIRGREGGGAITLNADLDGDLYLQGPSEMATQFGTSVAGLGDVDDDGMADFAVGAPFNPQADELVGAVFVVLGTPVLVSQPVQDYVNNGNGYRIDGPIGALEFGHSVAGVGDFNQDMRPDLAVGQPSFAKERGRVFVLYSPPQPQPLPYAVVDPLPQGAGVTISGPASMPMARFGAVIARAGDFDLDQAGDVVIGGSSTYARVLVVFGGTQAAAIEADQVASGGHGVVYTGATLMDGFGTAVGGGRDVNGDGRDDVVFGAPYQGDVGRVYVGFGRAAPATISAVELASGAGGFAIDGEGQGTWAGAAVALVPSVDEDELADVMLGAPHFGLGAGTDEGRVYVVHGGPCEQR